MLFDRTYRTTEMACSIRFEFSIKVVVLASCVCSYGEMAKDPLLVIQCSSVSFLVDGFANPIVISVYVYTTIIH